MGEQTVTGPDATPAPERRTPAPRQDAADRRPVRPRPG